MIHLPLSFISEEQFDILPLSVRRVVNKNNLLRKNRRTNHYELAPINFSRLSRSEVEKPRSGDLSAVPEFKDLIGKLHINYPQDVEVSYSRVYSTPFLRSGRRPRIYYLPPSVRSMHSYGHFPVPVRGIVDGNNLSEKNVIRNENELIPLRVLRALPIVNLRRKNFSKLRELKEFVGKVRIYPTQSSLEWPAHEQKIYL
ncbi:hypothetical protein AB6A40_001156 [Gnathostoma spinigerum]|uniref:Ribosomal protein S4 n=1 Tax=Gnathostoma spinigerum TaxID=75299 RepID=A0ABD6ECM8_9BILA